MNRRLKLTRRDCRSLAAVALLVLGARLIAKAVGLPDEAGLLALLLLAGAWGCVGFVRAERRREREQRDLDG